MVCAEEPFAGPEPVLRYLSRYTHLAIANSQLLSADHRRRHLQMQKSYRIRRASLTRYKTMTFEPPTVSPPYT